MSYIERYHVLPNALMPVITMVGTYFGSILGGSVIVENLFSFPGLGSYVLSAIWGRDYPVIQGYVLVSGTIFIFFNYLVDLSYYVLSPKGK
jgi:peptide/nickel transport system permease protein